MKTTVLNGNDVRNGNVKAAENGKPELSNSVVSAPADKKEEGTPELKPEVDQDKKPEAKITEPKPVPVAKRIERIEELKELCEKYEALAESRKKLSAFKFGADGIRDTLIMQDSRGNQWSTGNGKVTTAVHTLIMETLDKLISETEKEIKLSF